MVERKQPVPAFSSFLLGPVGRSCLEGSELATVLHGAEPLRSLPFCHVLVPPPTSGHSQASMEEGLAGSGIKTWEEQPCHQSRLLFLGSPSGDLLLWGGLCELEQLEPAPGQCLKPSPRIGIGQMTQNGQDQIRNFTLKDPGVAEFQNGATRGLRCFPGSLCNCRGMGERQVLGICQAVSPC